MNSKRRAMGSDTTSELYVEDSDHSNPSDDEVLHDPRLMQNHTSSTITTPTTINQITKHKSKKKHEYKASMTACPLIPMATITSSMHWRKITRQKLYEQALIQRLKQIEMDQEQHTELEKE
eukprot:459149_1